MSHLSISPFQLLEINLISAKDLTPVSKFMQVYAVAWLDPQRKLTTQIDQNGHTNPTWNEKFVFRVDDEFLNAENCVIMIEIYASAWLRDILIGTVGVLVSNILPPSARWGNRKSKLRFVALQIRRPSGRPQGILNIGVSLVDSTMRSMPMYSDLSASAVGYWDPMDVKQHEPNQSPLPPQQQKTKDHQERQPINPKILTLQRSQSEKNDSTINDYTYTAGKQGSGYNGSVVNGGSEIGVPRKGIVNANGSLCSDVGPSPSVVAAAIAKGIYPLSYPVSLPVTTGGSGLDEWSEKSNTEGVKTKIERWKNELPPVYDHLDYKKIKQTPKRVGQTPRRPPPKGRSGLFSCFGTAYGCEFSITCGGGNRKKQYGRGKARATASEITFDESYI